MKRETKQILCILIFMLAGALLGGWIAHMQRLKIDECASLWAAQNLPAPESLSLMHCVIGFALLLSGIPTGLMLYNHAARFWLTAAAPKIILGIVTCPIYITLGTVCSIPMLIYKGYILMKGRR